MRRGIGIALLVAAVLGALGASCKPAAGRSCKAGQVGCVTKSEALTCENGTFVSVACGNESCRVGGETLLCDQSTGELGQKCLGDMEYACSPDKLTGMQCMGGAFRKTVVCRGPRGCRIEGKRVACDTSLAEEGDACATEDALGCSGDKKTLLRCKLKVYEAYRPCRGPRSCVPDDTLPQCDNTLASVGDPCPQPGRVACSLDKTHELVCRGGRFETTRECKQGCSPSVIGTSILCK